MIRVLHRTPAVPVCSAALIWCDLFAKRNWPSTTHRKVTTSVTHLAQNDYFLLNSNTNNHCRYHSRAVPQPFPLFWQHHFLFPGAHEVAKVSRPDANSNSRSQLNNINNDNNSSSNNNIINSNTDVHTNANHLANDVAKVSRPAGDKRQESLRNVADYD